jgi:lactose/L-arabinose transport system substrate-binding protein
MAAENQSGLWGVAPIPKLTNASNATSSSNLGGSSWYVINDVDNTDAAVDFLGSTFAGNTDLYQTLLVKAGVIGTYKPAQSGEAYATKVEFFGDQAIYEDISKIASSIPAVNYGMHTYAFEDIVKAEVQNLMNGADVDTVLANAQKQAESQIR